MAKTTPAPFDLSDLGAKPLDLSDLGAQPATGPTDGSPIPVEQPPAAPHHPGGFAGQALANLRGTSQGLTGNFGDEALGWLVSKFPALNDLNVTPGNIAGQWKDIIAGRTPRPPDMPPQMTQEQATEYFRDRNKVSRAAFEDEYDIGQAQGATVLAASPVGKAAGLLEPGLTPALVGGAAYGLGASESQAPERQAQDMFWGGAINGAGTALGSGIGRGLGKLPDVVQNWIAKQKLVSPTPEAQLLMKKGVPLTLGQMDPTGVVGQMEGAATSTAGPGPAIKKLRDEAVEGWQRAAMDQGLPPGMDPAEPGMKLSQQQARAYEGFKEAYAPAKAIEVPPYATEVVPGRMAPSGQPLTRAVSMETGLERAAQDPNVDATGDIREAVGRFLQNQMTLLPPEAFDPGGRVTVGTVQKMRSNVRDMLRKALSGSAPNYEKAGLYANAEDYLTQVMEAGMTPEQRAVLQAIDKQYSTHKILQDTLARAGDRPEGFTPNMLDSAIQKSSEVGGYTRGELGGELRAIEQAGRAVLRDPPITGARALMRGPTPTLGGYALQYANLSPRMRQTMLGQMLSDPARVQAMGKYGEQLARAAAKGDDALVTEDFLLGSTDPEYQRLKREAAGAPAP
jgi:hypothetical protein